MIILKKKSSVRRKLIRMIFLGCMIPYVIGGVYLKVYIENVLYNNSKDNSRQLLEEIKEQIDNTLITDMEEELTLLASIEDVKKAEDGINQYMDYDPDTSLYKSYDREEAIKDIFKNYKESHKTTHFIFLGTQSGGYIEYPQFVPKESYDPRQRPWYIKTINQGGIVLSEPYITEVTKDIVISFTKRIEMDGRFIGVVGASINLSDLTSKIGQIKIGETGNVFVLSQSGQFIVSPGHPDWVLKTPEELGLDSFITLEESGETSLQGKHDGINCLYNSVESSQSGLRFISVASMDEILQKAHEITNILIVIYAATFIIIFFVVCLITQQISKPILDISSVIKRMTEFDFDGDMSLKQYTNRTDEIGIVSNAVVDMHENYVELMGQVISINEEIKNIDIKNHNIFKLELSKKNPFHEVINSINILLDKTFMYLEQLKNKNFEITEKNDLLAASEEELTAQLEEINQQKDYIHFLAYHDSLTDLPNRRSFNEYLTRKIEEGKRGAVILLDLDDFKRINDLRGHVFGDRVLDIIAKRFVTITNEKIFLSRFGGDEFLFLIEYEKDVSEVEDFANRISGIFYNKLQIDDNEIELHYSMGIALFPEDSRDVHQLIMDADLAMYSVKNSGKNGYQFYQSCLMDQQLKISRIETILRDAISNNGFKLVYQPKVDTRTGKIVGYEALLRLKEHAIPPSDFIPVAENNGLITAIGRLVTENVIRQLKEWKTLGLDIKPVSVNYSANQLNDVGYITFIQEQMSKHGIDTAYLEIEITENIFLENKQITLAFLKQLKEMGIKISIDDFGTGYSSLNYLTFLPADFIKLERSINLRFLERTNDKVMDSLISLVHSLGLTVVAEGIETYDQVIALKKAGCDLIQGYYFSKPVEADQVPLLHSTQYFID